MFTLKFYRVNDENGIMCQAVACPKYETSVRPHYTQVFIFRQIDDDHYADIILVRNIEARKDEPCKNGDIDFTLRYFDSCYIENATGKTIDTVRG